MTIQHNVIYKAPLAKFEELFTCSDLAGFCKNLNNWSDSFTKDKDKNNAKGWGFELFVELLIGLTPNNRQLAGLHNYVPILDDDTGADGRAVNWDGKDSLIQVKYRSNRTNLLTANEDHLSNLTTVAWKEGLYRPDVVTEPRTLFVFTTANGLHPYTECKFFNDYVKCFNFTDLSLLTDNETFWQAALQAIKDTRNG